MSTPRLTPHGLHDGEDAPHDRQGVQHQRHRRVTLLIRRARPPEEARELHKIPRRDVHQATPMLTFIQSTAGG